MNFSKSLLCLVDSICNFVLFLVSALFVFQSFTQFNGGGGSAFLFSFIMFCGVCAGEAVKLFFYYGDGDFFTENVWPNHLLLWAKGAWLFFGFVLLYGLMTGELNEHTDFLWGFASLLILYNLPWTIIFGKKVFLKKTEEGKK